MDEKTKQEEKIKELKSTNKFLKEKIKYFDNRFKSELKNSIRTAILAAFSFLIALQWRELITESIKKLSSESPFKGVLITTIIVTIISVIGIIITSELLSNKKE